MPLQHATRNDLPRPGQRRSALLALAVTALVLLPAASASHTPNPTAVTVAGSLQSEAGCSGDSLAADAAPSSP